MRCVSGTLGSMAYRDQLFLSKVIPVSEVHPGVRVVLSRINRPGSKVTAEVRSCRFVPHAVGELRRYRIRFVDGSTLEVPAKARIRVDAGSVDSGGVAEALRPTLRVRASDVRPAMYMVGFRSPPWEAESERIISTGLSHETPSTSDDGAGHTRWLNITTTLGTYTLRSTDLVHIIRDEEADPE